MVLCILPQTPLEILASEGPRSWVHQHQFIGNIITQDPLGSTVSERLTWQRLTMPMGMAVTAEIRALLLRVDGTQHSWLQPMVPSERHDTKGKIRGVQLC